MSGIKFLEGDLIAGIRSMVDPLRHLKGGVYRAAYIRGSPLHKDWARRDESRDVGHLTEFADAFRVVADTVPKP